MCPTEEQEKNNKRAGLPSQSLEACVLNEYTVALTDNVRGRHSPDVRQHIQHVLIRQLAAKLCIGLNSTPFEIATSNSQSFLDRVIGD